jgi:hypothetical protein
MKYLYFLSLLLYASCQTKPSESKIQADSTEIANVIAKKPTQEVVRQDNPYIYSYPATFQLTDETVSYNSFLHPGSVIFKDSTYESEEVLRIELLTPVRIISTSSTMQPQGGNICEQYFWYQIMMDDETEGWIYGSGLLKELNNESLSGERVSLNGTAYRLYYLKDSGVGASNSDGLTGCDEYIIPYFFNENKNTFHFIKIPDSTIRENTLFITNYLNWLGFLSNEGGGIIIQSIEDDEKFNRIALKANVFYQDGGAYAKIYISEDGNGNIELISFEEVPDKNENVN